MSKQNNKADAHKDGTHGGKNKKKSVGNPNGYIGKGSLGNTPKAFKGWSMKEIQRMARNTVRSSYKPGYTDLKQQGKEVRSLSKKRAADNKYYLDWLANRTDQMNAHAEAAEQAVQGQQAQMQSDATQALTQMRANLISQGEGHRGTVSQGEESTAFDVTPEMAHNLSAVVNERNLSNQFTESAANMRTAGDQSNFAMVAGMDANRQGELAKALGELRDKRRLLRLEQAGAQREEVARLLTQEIDKAKAKVDMRNMAASQDIAQQAQNLEQKKYRFDVRSEFRAQQETNRHNRASEKNDHRSTSEEIRHNKAVEKIDHLQALAAMKNARGGNEKKQASKEVTRAIQNGISAIKTNKEWSRLNTNAVQNKLQNKGMEPLLAQAAAELATKHKLSKSTINALKSIGYLVPNKFTG